jgi:hypothetical protein
MSKFIGVRVRIPYLIRLGVIGGAILFGFGVLMLGTKARVQAGGGFNTPAHIVIADQFNNRVVEIDPATHKVVWQFGDGSSVPGPHSVVGTNDAERYGELTLISGTGIPMTNPPTLPGCPPAIEQAVGCPDNRVILVNEAGNIIWQYGQNDGVAGSGFDQLNTPVQATVLPNGHFFITDQLNERIIEVTREKEIVWQYGNGVIGSGFDELSNPNSAELLSNGHILIADENNNRAIEVDRAKNIIHTYTAHDTVSGVAFASRLPNGNTLLTDSNNSRIVEVDKNDIPVWQFVTTTQLGSIGMPLPTRAVRLRNGNTLISDQFNNVVIEVNHEKDADIVFTQGQIGVIGNEFNQLNDPYDAKVIGDFTGLTPPPKD